MKSSKPATTDEELSRVWPIPPEATLGSAIRAKGIFQEIRAHLPAAVRKSLKLVAGELVLRMPASARDEFDATSQAVTEGLKPIGSLPVIPREIQDVLSITAAERHRWLKDGRLPSVGTRTVKLRGRARKITFHVFEPRMVEDVLDRDLVTEWREEDAITAAENRRRAAWKAKLTRVGNGGAKPAAAGAETPDGSAHPGLLGWDEFERDGPLR